MSFFNKKKADKSIKLIDISQFKVGLILQMSPGYHKTKPYYVEIVYFNSDAKNGDIIMTTSIPNKHECNMTIGSNWEYHHRRMTIIGNKREHSHLLYNQPLD